MAKGHCTGSHTLQGLLVVNSPLDPLFIDFTKVDPFKFGKEDILLPDLYLHKILSGLHLQ